MRPALALLFALGIVTGFARADDPAPVTDPAAVRAHYEQVAARPEFAGGDESLADTGWGDWLSQWVTHLVSRFRDFKYAGRFSSAARVLVIAMTIAAAAGLAYVLSRLSRRRYSRGESDAVPSTPKDARLSAGQYEARLQRALEARDWHGAWLAAWLQFLTRLEHRQFVETDRSRTNREYLAQLRGRRLPGEAWPLLARMVDDYDRVIYGGQSIDEPDWGAFRGRLEEITLMLDLRERTPTEAHA